MTKLAPGSRNAAAADVCRRAGGMRVELADVSKRAQSADLGGELEALAGEASRAEGARQELGRVRSVARAWSLTISEPRRAAQAVLFTYEALRSYSTEVAPDRELNPLGCDIQAQLSATSVALAASIGREAAKLPPLEAGHFLTSLYPSLLPPSERSARGAFYTPPALVERLLDLATEGGTDWSTAKVLDPATGGGVFLLHAAMRMIEAMDGSEAGFILAQLGHRLAGFEIDPYAAALAQTSLEIAFADLARASGRDIPMIVKQCDSLEEAPHAQFDLVIGNPPYGRVSLTAEQRARFGRSLYGHANLYGVFTDIAVRWTRPGGAIAYLTPTSMLGGQYYAALRGLLAREAPPTAIDFVHARKGVFEDVLQETLLALFRKGEKRTRMQVHYLHVTSEREAKLTKNGKVGLPADPTDPWLAPREPQHSSLIAAAEKMASRLSEWGYQVSTGPLVWNRFKDQLLDRPLASTHPLIWAEAVSADGQFAFRAQKKNHSPFFKLNRGDGWLLVTDACVLVQRTTAKEQARRLIAAELPESFIRAHGGVVVENHLNMVRPIGKPAVSPAAVAFVLNSEVVDQVFRCISGSVAVSAFELESIPLPSATDMKRIERMIAKRAPRREIEDALNGLYRGSPK